MGKVFLKRTYGSTGSTADVMMGAACQCERCPVPPISLDRREPWLVCIDGSPCRPPPEPPWPPCPFDTGEPLYDEYSCEEAGLGWNDPGETLGGVKEG
jgi:hypothetical protein